MDKFELKITPSSYTEERTYIENESGEDIDCEPYQHTTNYVSAEIIINNQKIKSFVDYFALFYDVLDRGYTNPFWSEGQGTDSNFYPFTCSCGIAGCASIWNGIFSKHRKYTVEYRIKNKELNGYSFLPKSFYSFNKKAPKRFFNYLLNPNLCTKEAYLSISLFFKYFNKSLLLPIFFNKPLFECLSFGCCLK